MTAGRPTDYNEDIIKKTNEYLKNYKEQGDVIPNIAGLACYLKIARSTIYDWASQGSKKEFSDSIEDILSSQERELINGGLLKKYSDKITNLMLSNHHNYRTKSEVDFNDKTNELTDEELEQIVTRSIESRKRVSETTEGGEI